MWQIGCKASKRSAMRITMDRKKIVHSDYRIYGQSLEVVDGRKYLGVKVTEDMPWSNHIVEALSKRFGYWLFRVYWLVGCFGFNGPLRQYFSLYRAVSQREGERGEKG